MENLNKVTKTFLKLIEVKRKLKMKFSADRFLHLVGEFHIASDSFCLYRDDIALYVRTIIGYLNKLELNVNVFALRTTWKF